VIGTQQNFTKPSKVSFTSKDWKENLKNKLDNLENIVQTIKDNFSLSLETVWARVEMLAWALMLIGYMYLTFVDLGLIKK
jgi:hypothetical protein